MNILLIVSWYKSKENPVCGSFFEEQARALMKRGHHVTIYNPEFLPLSSKGNSNLVEYDDDGLRTITHHIKAKVPRSRFLNYKYLEYRALSTLKKLGILNDLDIVHAHTFRFAGIVAKRVLRETGIPYVLTEHFTQLINKGGIEHPVDLKYAKQVYGDASMNFAVSSFFKKELLKRFPSAQFDVFHNIVADEFLTTATGDYSEKIVLFSVAFLVERKNHRLQLEAFKLFLTRFPEAVLKIGGDGVARKQIEQLVEELDLQNNVQLLGLLSRAETLKYMGEASLFVHTSFLETFGVVLIEALAMGVPVLALDSGGPRDIITEENGILVKENDPQRFSEAMITALTNRVYEKDMLRADIKSRFSEEVIIGQLEQYYEEVVNEN